MTVKRLILIGGTLIFTSVLNPSTAQADGKTVQICNMRGATLNVAIGWMDYGFPSASGWYVFNINQCRTLNFPKADSLLPLFAYAEDSEGNVLKPSNSISNGIKNNFCISRNAFSEKSTTLCQMRDGATGQITSEWQEFGGLGFPFADFYRWELR